MLSPPPLPPQAEPPSKSPGGIGLSLLGLIKFEKTNYPTTYFPPNGKLNLFVLLFLSRAHAHATHARMVPHVSQTTVKVLTTVFARQANTTTVLHANLKVKT